LENRKNNFWITIVENQGLIIFLITIVLGCIFTLFNKNFMTLSNLNAIVLNSCILIILAAAEGIVILTGNIDVSVASMLALASYIGFDIFAKFPEIGVIGILIPLAVGGLCGLFNGYFVGSLKLPPIIITLGTMSIFRGLAVLYARGNQINAHQIPPWVNTTINGSFFGVSYLVIYTVLIVLGIHFFLRYYRVGRKIYAIGSNPEAARYFGLDISKITLLAYVVAGVFVGFTGYLYGARASFVAPYYADGWEMQAIAAACLGGISMKGGSGKVIGAALGAFLLGTLDNGLVLLGAPQFVRELIYGAAIVVAIVVNSALMSRIQMIIQKNKAIRRGYGEQF
jgi:rhamnose transport system permease protein